VKLICVFGLLCATCTTVGPVEMTHRFVKTDDAFAPSTAGDFPDLLADEREIAKAAPFKSVGVLEVRGRVTEGRQRFLDHALNAGADLGCDVIVQRDHFQRGRRDWIRGARWRGDEIATWQFLCGVSGVTEQEAKSTRRTAVLTAARMRDEELSAPPGRDLGVLVASSVTDPGPRGGAPGAGGPLASLDAEHLAFFNAASKVFAEVNSVSGGVADENGRGLGPAFNANSCMACHIEPALGGSSTHPTLGFAKQENPLIAFAALDRLPGANQTVPPFIVADGPIREARFVRNPDGTRDGGVHALYTIAGRVDAPDCALAQPPFADQVAAGNVIYRIPTPIFGAGLVESVSDATLTASFAATASARAALGIRGRFNRSGNDGTITRFGWKAQNKSLLMFVAEAYNVEQGVTSELFPNERATAENCNLNPTPEDTTNLRSSPGTASAMSSDIVNFAAFARMLAPPTPTTASASEQNGSKLFASIGCALCHTVSLVADASPYTGPIQAARAYSDFALHHMGPGLADGISQGAAGPDEFRTAPLWGVGQRIFFLHDGRAGPKNGGLVAAILAHSSTNRSCSAQQMTDASGAACRSEANASVGRFSALSPPEQQDVINFLRSL
jgi:CxxC motif-containing protein (DUF1111 family)